MYNICINAAFSPGWKVIITLQTESETLAYAAEKSKQLDRVVKVVKVLKELDGDRGQVVAVALDGIIFKQNGLYPG